ncbi:MAG: AarF/ABC1/UbiB kinase family protein, partial [Myxococcales bacterium]|nr:AarF/ABC1/UbiB kinase family protein [Myxococcales bacterium]
MIRLTRGFFFFGRIALSYFWLFALIKLFGRKKMRTKAELVHQKNSIRLYTGMLRLQGVYIKMGQVLSVMGSFLPEVYIRQLEKLQDAVPPKPFSAIKRAIEREHHKGVDEIFESFDREPEAAASLGQVHRATLPGGQPVAVKVLYPGIDRIVRMDLKILRLALRVYGWFVPVARIERIMDQVDDVLKRETNYLNEAKNLEE